ncbi:hypothetical protein GOP47_0018688 [Adiantum capillus-veneris]|uniref:Senescence domain-containing protein n=1 Tax=Adiantum capillus-veneris TaxID=13818 RepID=A0A9D4UDN8_ADICA|nr:hypothetical protein GOP47_0018688 [Adiantum capillus-veneris]
MSTSMRIVNDPSHLHPEVDKPQASRQIPRVPRDAYPFEVLRAMDPQIHYPSLNAPAETPLSSDQQSRLRYPDPVSIDAITADLSKKIEVSPVEASETLLVSVPDAVAHLVDREASPHLASGPFSIVRLNQDGNGIAVFARVGKELQWPLTKDQAAVKLDPSHYFFSVMVPPEIEKECRLASPTAEKSSSSGDDSLLNYGITFSSNTDMECLKQLDEVLKQYCCFKAPQVTTQRGGDKLVAVENDQKVNEISATAGLGGVPAEDYWTALAPNVEDYSSSVARAIASGAGQIIRGIFWCSEATIAQLEKGNHFMQGKIKSKDSPTKISPSATRRIQRVQKISAMSEQIVGGVLSGVLKAAAFITRPLVTSKAGQKLLSLMPGQVALASLDGFGKIFDALEVAGKNVLTTTSTATTGLVTQRYGGEAGQFTQQGFNAVGGFLTTAWTISKLRKITDGDEKDLSKPHAN